MRKNSILNVFHFKWKMGHVKYRNYLLMSSDGCNRYTSCKDSGVLRKYWKRSVGEGDGRQGLLVISQKTRIPKEIRSFCLCILVYRILENLYLCK